MIIMMTRVLMMMVMIITVVIIGIIIFEWIERQNGEPIWPTSQAK